MEMCKNCETACRGGCMSVKACRECGGPVSGRASRCPHCGESDPAATDLQRNLPAIIAGVVVLGVAVMAMFGNAGKERDAVDPASPPAIDSAALANANTPQSRAEYADDLERSYLSAGLDVRVTLTGPKQTTLRITWVLVGRPAAYQMMNDASLTQNLQRRGFKKVVLSDGYNESYSWPIR